MKVIRDLLSSKKFLALLLTIIGALISGYSGTVAWPDALKACLVAVGIYLGAQGISDGLSGGMTSSQPDTPSSKDIAKNP